MLDKIKNLRLGHNGIFGVCDGLGEATLIPALIFRIAFGVMWVKGGFFIYWILLLAMWLNTNNQASKDFIFAIKDEMKKGKKKNNNNNAKSDINISSECLDFDKFFEKLDKKRNNKDSDSDLGSDSNKKDLD